MFPVNIFFIVTQPKNFLWITFSFLLGQNLYFSLNNIFIWKEKTIFFFELLFLFYTWPKKIPWKIDLLFSLGQKCFLWTTFSLFHLARNVNFKHFSSSPFSLGQKVFYKQFSFSFSQKKIPFFYFFSPKMRFFFRWFLNAFFFFKSVRSKLSTGMKIKMKTLQGALHF